jgi:hypothetical protein
MYLVRDKNMRLKASLVDGLALKTISKAPGKWDILDFEVGGKTAVYVLTTTSQLTHSDMCLHLFEGDIIYKE